MKIVWLSLWIFLYSLSLLPFWVLHRISDVLYFFVYVVFGYRRRVVRENLVRSFPEKPLAEIVEIEKKFYQGFCDLVVETIKSFSFTAEQMSERFKNTTPGSLSRFQSKNINVMAGAAHLGNWEWLNFAASLDTQGAFYGIYKPLGNEYFNTLLVKNRSRFGTNLVATKSLRDLYHELVKQPFVVAVLADQAPHYYPKAIQVTFLNQKTYVSPGPGLMVAQKGYFPLWGWVRRTGRSRYEWGVEDLESVAPFESFSEEDQKQVERISQMYALTREQACTVLKVTQDYCQKLEAKIKVAPQDWLWSHRRWKSRD